VSICHDLHSQTTNGEKEKLVIMLDVQHALVMQHRHVLHSPLLRHDYPQQARKQQVRAPKVHLLVEKSHAAFGLHWRIHLKKELNLSQTMANVLPMKWMIGWKT
jgi:hypothetical protein